MAQHRISAIHQRAGEIVYMSSGWPHLVKNLTDTVSFGNSYLRPWHFDAFCSFLKTSGVDQAERLINVRGVIARWLQAQWQQEWGIAIQ